MPDSSSARPQTFDFNFRSWQSLALWSGVLWTIVWLALAITLRWNSQQEDPAFSIIRCLLVALPLAFYFQLLWNKRVGVRRHLLIVIATCYLFMLLAILGLGGWLSVGAVSIAVAFLHLTHWTDETPATALANSAADRSDLQTDAPSLGDAEGPEALTPSRSDFDQQEMLQDAGEQEMDLEEIEESPDDSWIQQMTRRTLETSTDLGLQEQIEWFGRHQWQDDESQIELHVLFQPSFATEPEIQCEVIEGVGRVKVSQVFPHGARLELKAGPEVSENPPQASSLVWLSAIGTMAEPDGEDRMKTTS